MKARGKNQKKLDGHYTKLFKVMAVAIFACLFFCAGFLLRGNEALMQRLGVDASSDESVDSTSSGTSDDLAARIAEVESILQTESLDTYDLDTSTEATIEAFLESTDDSFTRYFSSSRYLSYLDSTSEDYPGIGVLFAESEGKAYALDVFEDSSASEAGVQPGDFVVAIDGDRSQDWTATEAISAVEREAGSTVVITWLRPDSENSSTGEEFTTTLTCADYSEPNVSIDLVDDTVGYVKLSQFTQNADTLVSDALERLNGEGAQAFVLDLRDNPGGYLTKAVDVASLFIRSGTVVQIETVSSGTTTKQVSGDVVTDAPLVVLVNENTAGAAEVLAAALRDTNRATLVGTTTMGKGSVQVTKSLSFGGAVRYTAALYKSPDGYSIDQVGIAPDIAISQSDDSSDEQLDLALETAASLVESS